MKPLDIISKDLQGQFPQITASDKGKSRTYKAFGTENKQVEYEDGTKSWKTAFREFGLPSQYDIIDGNQVVTVKYIQSERPGKNGTKIQVPVNVEFGASNRGVIAITHQNGVKDRNLDLFLRFHPQNMSNIDKPWHIPNGEYLFETIDSGDLEKKEITRFAQKSGFLKTIDALTNDQLLHIAEDRFRSDLEKWKGSLGDGTEVCDIIRAKLLDMLEANPSMESELKSKEQIEFYKKLADCEVKGLIVFDNIRSEFRDPVSADIIFVYEQNLNVRPHAQLYNKYITNKVVRPKLDLIFQKLEALMPPKPANSKKPADLLQ